MPRFGSLPSSSFLERRVGANWSRPYWTFWVVYKNLKMSTPTPAHQQVGAVYERNASRIGSTACYINIFALRRFLYKLVWAITSMKQLQFLKALKSRERGRLLQGVIVIQRTYSYLFSLPPSIRLRTLFRTRHSHGLNQPSRADSMRRLARSTCNLAKLRTAQRSHLHLNIFHG